MYPLSIGVLMDGFRTDTLTALDKAVAVGATGIQVYATRGEMSPENMNAAVSYTHLTLPTTNFV